VAPETHLITKTDGKDVKTPNPAYEEWEAADQQVLSFLLTSLSKEVMIQVSSCETAAAAWKIIEEAFASQTRARIVNVRIALATTKKGNSSAAEYFAKMKSLGDEMAAAGRHLDDDELVEYIITGLGEDFTSLVTALTARVEPISVGELYSQLLNFETRMDLTYGNSSGGSTNVASCGHGGNRGGPRDQRGQQRGSGRGRGSQCGRGTGGPTRGGARSFNKNNSCATPQNTEDGQPLCQVCYKKEHTTEIC